MSVNKTIHIGNLGADPVIRTAQDGKRNASFSIAVSEKWKDRTGEYREKTEWVKVVVFNDGLVNIIEKHLRKGVKVYVEGKLQTRKWTGKDGKDNYITEVILQGYDNKLEIIENKKDADFNNTEEEWGENR